MVGYDLTFSAPKSVSILWAAADSAGQASRSGAIDKAVAVGMDYIEEQAAWVGRGKRPSPRPGAGGRGLRPRHVAGPRPPAAPPRGGGQHGRVPAGKVVPSTAAPSSPTPRRRATWPPPSCATSWRRPSAWSGRPSAGTGRHGRGGRGRHRRDEQAAHRDRLYTQAWATTAWPPARSPPSPPERPRTTPSIPTPSARRGSAAWPTPASTLPATPATAARPPPCWSTVGGPGQAVALGGEGRDRDGFTFDRRDVLQFVAQWSGDRLTAAEIATWPTSG